MEDFGKCKTELTLEKCMYNLPHEWKSIKIYESTFLDGTKEFQEHYRCRRCGFEKVDRLVETPKEYHGMD